MKVELAKVGAVVLDSLPFSQFGTWGMACAWHGAGVSAFCGYLGSIDATRLGYVLDAGLAFMPVSYAGEYEDGAADEIKQIKALGIPQGASVWLDLEGMRAFKSDPVVLAGKVNAWARDIRAAGWMPCLYVGVPQPFTSAELFDLEVQRYWHGQGSVRDRHGLLAEPFRTFQQCRGWNMVQAAPSMELGGVMVDYSMVLGDYRGDVPRWVTSSPK